VITGASKLSQLRDNLRAVEVSAEARCRRDGADRRDQHAVRGVTRGCAAA
jgi:aryl-alcohol dehydrogenase-like predicted oxidoreductase